VAQGFLEIGGLAMKNKLLSKCIILLGFLLFFTFLIPFTGFNVSTVKAASIEPEKNDVYRLNLKSRTLVKGKSFTLKVYNLGDNAKLMFKSDDDEIASVSDDGTITANKVGTTIITVTIKDGGLITPLTCDITVGLPAFSVKLTKSRIIIGLGNTDFLNVILKPSNTVEDARFSSNDSSVAYVSTGGRLSAKNYGLTYVFAEIDAPNLDGSRKYSRCTVIVTSEDDASLLEKYFNDHPELDYISEDSFTNAIDYYFNVKYDPTSSTSFVTSFNHYLDEKFDLSKLSAQRDSDLEKIQ